MERCKLYTDTHREDYRINDAARKRTYRERIKQKLIEYDKNKAMDRAWKKGQKHRNRGENLMNNSLGVKNLGCEKGRFDNPSGCSTKQYFNDSANHAESALLKKNGTENASVG